MKKNKFLVALLLSALFSCVSQGSKENEPQPDSTHKPDTYSQQGEPAPGVSEAVKSEINEFPGLGRDSIKIVYRGIADTLHGYLSEDSILHVEGDIMIRYDRVVKGVGTTHRLWPKAGRTLVIPYRIAPAYDKDTASRNMIIQAMKMWEQMSAVRFVEKRRSHFNFIEFVPSEFTQSYIGMVGGGQQIELANWAKKGNVAHEIGHSLGLYHEQSRADRDSFVAVKCSDINYRHAYKKDPYAKDVGRYNYNSIMHYPRTSCMEFIRLRPGDRPGQRDSIAVTDFATIKTIYGL